MIKRIRVLMLVILAILSGFASHQNIHSDNKTPVPLSHDATLGTIIDQTGCVYIRPILNARWQVAHEGRSLITGDWIKTPFRGPNAVTLQLKNAGNVLLGPGSLAEVKEGPVVRLFRGEADIQPNKGSAITMEGPDKSRHEITQNKLVRISGETLVFAAEKSGWLNAYKKNANPGVLGRLLADIDGRTVPLTLGRHHVSVEIRDQIARTIIDETFVNNTDEELEGIFHLTLPPDASISGFAMWVGDQLVQGEIAEKQRAREIFETIRREKRDPALLEWTGGGVFKTRVYPIPANGKKRVRITYTQVLPKVGNVYRYRHPLRSDHLAQHPLESLQITVSIASAERLASVQCPSHMTRNQVTAHAASIEYSAEKYAASSDFEVAVTTAPARDPAMIRSYAQDGDGYFMLFVSPPSHEASPHAESPRTGEPLDFILVADTSCSMTDALLRIQRTFIAQFLETLGKKDRFNVLMFDVQPEWIHKGPVQASPETIEKTLNTLEKRGGLGWTDLGEAFKEAFQRAEKNSHIIYTGDGLAKRGAADLAACLKAAYKGKGSCHAVAVGGGADDNVLSAMASFGKGSIHSVAETREAGKAAEAVLAAATGAGMRGIKLSWQGVHINKVYPRKLSFLPLNRQLVLLGRYPAETDSQKGVLTVSGILNGEHIAREMPVSFAHAEEGNSFIPRLWARRHLGHLLAQEVIEDDKPRIIALSEKYQIITPYTSFLVLESEEDRLRFQLKKRLRRLDGEDFFAEGMRDAAFDLSVKHTQEARLWRRNLRKKIFRYYQTMGWHLRSIAMLENPYYEEEGRDYYFVNGHGDRRPMKSIKDGLSRPVTAGETELYCEDITEFATSAQETDADFYTDADLKGSDAGEETSNPDGELPWFDDNMSSFIEKEPESYSPSFGFHVSGATNVASRMTFGNLYTLDGPLDVDEHEDMDAPDVVSWGSLFPRPMARHHEPVLYWANKIQGALAHLNRRKALAGITAPFRMTISSERLDKYGRPGTATHTDFVHSGDAWAMTVQPPAGQFPALNWLGNGSCGVCDLGRLLGSRRPQAKGDNHAFPAPFAYYFEDLENIYPDHVPFATQDGAMTILTLKSLVEDGASVCVHIDAGKQAIVKIATFRGKLKTTSIIFKDFFTLAKLAWPRRIEWRDGEGRLTRTTAIKYGMLTPSAFDKSLTTMLEPVARAVIIDHPLPSLEDAKEAVLNQAPSLSHLWTLICHYTKTYQWRYVDRYLAAFTKLEAGKPGLDWIRLANQKKRGRDITPLLFQMARHITGRDGTDRNEASSLLAERACAEAILGKLDHPDEDHPDEHEETMRALLRILKPVYDRQASRHEAAKAWDHHFLGTFPDCCGWHAQDAFPAHKAVAEKYPRDVDVQLAYIDALHRDSEIEQAIAFVPRIIKENDEWDEADRFKLKERLALILYTERRYEAFIEYVDAQNLLASPLAEKLCSHYLSARVILDRRPEAEALARAWLALGPEGGARFHAALIPPEETGWFPRNRQQLMDMALKYAESDGTIVQKILDSLTFQYWETKHPASRGDWEVRHALYRELYLKLTGRLDKLSPMMLRNLYTWSDGYEPRKEEWSRTDLHQKIYERWEREPDPFGKKVLAHLIRSWHEPDWTGKLWLRQLETTDSEAHRASIAERLFTFLLTHPWRPEREQTLFRIRQHLGMGEAGQTVRIDAFQLLVPYIIYGFGRSLDEPDSDSYYHFQTIKREHLRQAHTRAHKLITNLERGCRDPHERMFITVERLALALRLQKHDARTADALLSIFHALEKRGPDVDGGNRSQALAERCLLLLSFLASHPEAEPDMTKRVLSAISTSTRSETHTSYKRLALARLLIALDRPQPLEANLSKWISGTGRIRSARWRLLLGYLKAEQGELAKAVEVFESLAAWDSLSADDYQALARWHTALGQQDKYSEAMLKSYDQWRAENLLESIYTIKQRRHDNQSSRKVSETLYFMLHAYVRKMPHKDNAIHQLADAMERFDDNRLFALCCETISDMSGPKLFSLLDEWRDHLGYLDNAFNLSGLLKEIERAVARTSRISDQRGLRLLQFLAAARALVLSDANPSPQFIKTAGEALKASLEGPWQDNDRILFANFVMADSHELPDTIQAAIIAAIRAQYNATSPGSETRLSLASLLSWELGQNKEAVMLLAATLDEIRRAHGGMLPFNMQTDSIINSYITSLMNTERVIPAEKLLRQRLSRASREQIKQSINRDLKNLYCQALEAGHKTTLGSGAELYKHYRDNLLDGLKTPKHAADLRNTLSKLCDLMQSAHKAGIDRVKNDLMDFAFHQFPGLRRRHRFPEWGYRTGELATFLADTMDIKKALSFLALLADEEPPRLREAGKAIWHEQDRCLSSLLNKYPGLDEFDRKMFSVTLSLLKSNLYKGAGSLRDIFLKKHDLSFWSEKVDHFRDVVLETLKKNPKSTKIAQKAAAFLSTHLDRHSEAADALMPFQRNGRLPSDEQDNLISYLEKCGRHADIPAILESPTGPISTQPSDVSNWTHLMHAYHVIGQDAKVLATLTRAEAQFKDRDDFISRQLAVACLGTGLYHKAVSYFKELIAGCEGWQRDFIWAKDPRKDYYRRLADAHFGLGKLDLAVEAATRAVLHSESGGTWYGQLVKFFKATPDLSGYAARFHAECIKGGHEIPIIRKALGYAFLKKEAFKKAILHLEACMAHVAGDLEACALLAQAYEKAGMTAAALKEYKKLARWSGHDLERYADLGRRYAQHGQMAASKRAFASIEELSDDKEEIQALLDASSLEE